MTLLINLYGAPGSGKSTGASYIFSKLKMLNINCEIVQEFAKDKVWEDSKKVFENQMYIFGKQSFRLSRLNDEVDVIITDSPLFNSKIYSNDEYIGNHLSDLALYFEETLFNKNILNFFIKRMKPYNSKGRFQNETESNELSEFIKENLNKYNINYEIIDGTEKGYDTIIKIIEQYVKEHNSHSRL